MSAAVPSAQAQDDGNYLFTAGTFTCTLNQDAAAAAVALAGAPAEESPQESAEESAEELAQESAEESGQCGRYRWYRTDIARTSCVRISSLAPERSGARARPTLEDRPHDTLRCEYQTEN